MGNLITSPPILEKTKKSMLEGNQIDFFKRNINSKIASYFNLDSQVKLRKICKEISKKIELIENNNFSKASITDVINSHFSDNINNYSVGISEENINLIKNFYSFNFDLALERAKTNNIDSKQL